MKLTPQELRNCIESIKYSIQRVRDYPHASNAEKQRSLDPLLSAKEKLSELLKQKKGE